MAQRKTSGGWFYESTRHALAARGIPTGRRFNATTTGGSGGSWTGGTKLSNPWSKVKAPTGQGSWAGKVTVKSGGSGGGSSGSGGGGGGSSGGSSGGGTGGGGGGSAPAAKVVQKLTSASGATTATGEAAKAQAKLLAAKGQTGYNAALGGYVKADGTLAPTNNPNYVPAGESGGYTPVKTVVNVKTSDDIGKEIQQRLAAQNAAQNAPVVGTPTAVIVGNKLDVDKAATWLKTAQAPDGSWTNTPGAMAIMNQAAKEGRLQELQTALMAGKPSGPVGVTGTGALMSYFPTQITADNPKGLSLNIFKFGSPETMMSQAANTSTAQGPIYVSPDQSLAYVPRTATQILADPNVSMITPNVSSVMNENIMRSMADDAAITYKAMMGTIDLARSQGVELTKEDAANAIAAQFGLTPGMSYTPTQQKFLKVLNELVPPAGGGGVPPSAREVTPMVQQLQVPYTPVPPQYYDLGTGGTLRALFRSRYGKPEWTLSDIYRSRFKVGRDISTGLTNEQVAAIGATAAGGTVAYGLSSGKRTAGETAQQAAVYAARKRFTPWRR